MQRINKQPRNNWQSLVEGLGMDFHNNEAEKPYWLESAYYSFSLDEINKIEKASNELEEMCFALATDIIENKRFNKLNLGKLEQKLVIDSWEKDEHSVYGRFDLSLGADGSIKMLEYNADTPTSLYEASVIQWQWLQDCFPAKDQFNSIHERLIKAWEKLNLKAPIYFTTFEENREDYVTATYMRDVANQAGYETRAINLPDIGLKGKKFVDLSERDIENCFKLYPWEWMVTDEFGKKILGSNTRFIEPAWKMVLSNKAILPLLYEMFPDSPYLLRASFERFEPAVRKPFLSREGANIAYINEGLVEYETEGDYSGPYIYQEYHETVSFEDNGKNVIPIIGSWIIAGESSGIGIREDYGVTTNMASFVPHIIGE